MEGFKICKQGAEAKIYQGEYLGKAAIIKERFKKSYRHPDLDTKISQDRIKAEVRIMSRCRNFGIITPLLYLVDLERQLIVMQYYKDSITSKQFIDDNNKDTDALKKLSQDIGIMLAKMHKNNIIHGDLTTSNMLLIKKNPNEDYNYENLTLALIDFGLSSFDSSAEDKGVDLYVLERALISTHTHASEIFSDILSSYKKHYAEGVKVVKKFEEVRARGRKRTMIG